jgi:hypothetical protein
MNYADENKVLKILKKEKLAYIATTNGRFVDNAVVCYSSIQYHIYFGCYEDTLKGWNIKENPNIALAIGALQIHGTARKIEYKSSEYNEMIKSYGEKWPKYLPVFDIENNQLYEIKSKVIWLYNPSKGEMNRDVLIFDESYYKELKPYESRKEYKNKRNAPNNRFNLTLLLSRFLNSLRSNARTAPA